MLSAFYYWCRPVPLVGNTDDLFESEEAGPGGQIPRIVNPDGLGGISNGIPTETGHTDILQHIPNEMLSEILYRLSSADLASVSLVSHRLHNVSQALLIKAPNLTTGYPRGERGNPHSLERFLRLVTTPGNQDLALRVRELNLYWNHPWKTSRQDLVQPMAGDQHPTPSPPQISYEIPNEQIMLLLRHLPRLAVLHITSPTRRFSFHKFIECLHVLSPSEFPAAFQSLQEFRYTSKGAHAGMNCEALSVLLKLPNLRTIEARLIDDGINDPTSDAWTSARTSSTTQLHLIAALVRPRWLSRLLATPRVLTHFTFSASPVHRNHQFHALRSTLRRIRGTLVYLHVDLGGVDNGEEEEEEEDAEEVLGEEYTAGPGFIGSLADWPRLRTVRCSMVALVGYKLHTDTAWLAGVLPGGIRELEVLVDDYFSLLEMVRAVVRLLADKERVVPMLERVMVATPVMKSGERVPAGTQGEVLKMVCDAAGVVVVEEW